MTIWLLNFKAINTDFLAGDRNIHFRVPIIIIYKIRLIINIDDFHHLLQNFCIFRSAYIYNIQTSTLSSILLGYIEQVFFLVLNFRSNEHYYSFFLIFIDSVLHWKLRNFQSMFEIVLSRYLNFGVSGVYLHGLVGRSC